MMVYFRLCAAVLIVACFSRPVMAQPDDDDVDTPGLTVDALAGWKGMTSVSAPVPISFLFSNFTDGPIEGELVLVDDWGGNKVSLGEVYLTAGQTRRFSTVRSMRQWNRCLAELRSGNLVLWRRQLLLNNGVTYNRTSNHVLIVNDSQRMLEFSGSETDSDNDPSAAAPAPPPPNVVVVNQTMPPLVSMNAMTWQLPTHVGPLRPISAIVFPGPMPADRLNAGQWKALAEFVCQGGTVFLPASEEHLRDALSAASPLGLLPPQERDGWTTWESGLGAVRTFDGALFLEQANPEESRIAELIKTQEHQDLHRQIALSSHYYRESGRAERSRISILTFMTIYTLLSGLVTLAFVRRKSRTVAMYVGSLVGVACIAAVILGGGVRLSQGDVSWVSVTRLTENGALQYAEFEVQSAGGRSDRLSVTGRQPDMQVSTAQAETYYGNVYYDPDPHPSFDVQTTRAADRPNSFEASVPITPWGRRELVAFDYLPDLNAMDVQLDFTPQAAANGGPPTGELRLQLTNNTGIDLSDCRLCVAVGADADTIAAFESARSERLRRYGYWQQQEQVPTRYRSVSVGEVRAGATKSVQFAATPDLTSWAIQTQEGSFSPPSATKADAVRIWLVSKIADSPALQIDEPNSNFGAVTEVHFLAQELTSDQIPAEFRSLGSSMINAQPSEP